MSTLAGTEGVCSKTSESSNTTMAVDDNAMGDSIETNELINGYSEILSEKSCKENYIPESAQSDNGNSDSTSQNGTPRSEHSSIPMEDAEDTFSLKLRLSDDEDDGEMNTSEKLVSKKTEELSNQSSVENSNEETEKIPEISNLKENNDNISAEKQDNTTVSDILNDIDDCLTENSKNLRKITDNDKTDKNEEKIEALPENIDNGDANTKDISENKTAIEIDNMSTQATEGSGPSTSLLDNKELETKSLEENENNVADQTNEAENAEEASVENFQKAVQNDKTPIEASTEIIEEGVRESNSRRTSETFKRKLDEEELQGNIDTKKLKTEPIKSKLNEGLSSEDQSSEQTKQEEQEIKIKKDEKIKPKEEKSDVKKKLILRILPLLFENEKIPDVNIEELILTKIIEGITQRTELAALRQKSQSQEQLIDQLRKKATHLTKQLEDISTVTNRLTVDLQNKDRPVAPVKITRSVGLQVAMPGITKRGPGLVTTPNFVRKRPATSTVNLNSSTSKTSQSTTNSMNTSVKQPPTANTNASYKSPSLLNKALTKPTAVPRNIAVAAPAVPPKPAETPAKPTKEKSATDRPVTVDLTDEDLDSNKNKNAVASQNPPGLIPLTTGNIRMVSSLGNTMATNSLTNQSQRVTYLMATPAGPGQNRQLLIATSTPTGPRPSLTVVGQPNVRGAQGTRYLVNANGQQALVPRPSIVLTNGQPSNAVRVPVRVNNNTNRSNGMSNNRPVNPTIHPAPLPILMNQPHLPTWRQIPPRPTLKISRTKDGGIQLSWSMPELDQKVHEEVASYQLYAYQEGTAPPSTDLWRKVGDVKALPLPMACTLTSFHPGNKYYFAVRAIDVHSRLSQFSYPQPISLHN